MANLEKLTQDAEGSISRIDESYISQRVIYRRGKMQTLVLQNPESPDSFIKNLSDDSAFIPSRANAYLASEFNPDTQHIRKPKEDKREKIFSVYAIQFYKIINEDD